MTDISFPVLASYGVQQSPVVIDFAYPPPIRIDTFSFSITSPYTMQPKRHLIRVIESPTYQVTGYAIHGIDRIGMFVMFNYITSDPLLFKRTYVLKADTCNITASGVLPSLAKSANYRNQVAIPLYYQFTPGSITPDLQNVAYTKTLDTKYIGISLLPALIISSNQIILEAGQNIVAGGNDVNIKVIGKLLAFTNSYVVTGKDIQISKQERLLPLDNMWIGLYRNTMNIIKPDRLNFTDTQTVHINTPGVLNIREPIRVHGVVKSITISSTSMTVRWAHSKALGTAYSATIVGYDLNVFKHSRAFLGTGSYLYSGGDQGIILPPRQLLDNGQVFVTGTDIRIGAPIRLPIVRGQVLVEGGVLHTKTSWQLINPTKYINIIGNEFLAIRHFSDIVPVTFDVTVSMNSAGIRLPIRVYPEVGSVSISGDVSIVRTYIVPIDAASIQTTFTEEAHFKSYTPRAMEASNVTFLFSDVSIKPPMKVIADTSTIIVSTTIATFYQHLTRDLVGSLVSTSYSAVSLYKTYVPIEAVPLNIQVNAQNVGIFRKLLLSLDKLDVNTNVFAMSPTVVLSFNTKNINLTGNSANINRNLVLNGQNSSILLNFTDISTHVIKFYTLSADNVSTQVVGNTVIMRGDTTLRRITNPIASFKVSSNFHILVTEKRWQP